MSEALAIRVRPRSARDEVAGEHDGAVVVRVTAPPADGRANKAVVKVIAKRARVAPSRVRIVRGEGSREKLIRVDGMSAAELRAALLG